MASHPSFPRTALTIALLAGSLLVAALSRPRRKAKPSFERRVEEALERAMRPNR